MSRRRSRPVALSIAATTVAVASMSAGCLTDGQVRSVQSQVKEIRRQVDQVTAVRAQEASALQAAPEENRDGGQAADGLGSAAPKAAPSPPSPKPESASGSQEAERLCREGYALYHRDEFAAAETSLRRCLELRPEGEEGATARLLIAGSLTARGRDREAIDALQPLIDLGRPPALAARALYERGLCRLRLGLSELAREDFKAVQDQFPGSDVAPLARERLRAP